MKKKSGKEPRSTVVKKKEAIPFALPPVTADAGGQVPIAGVGASAGGLEAFSALLQSLPQEPGLAIVFVQHLAPQHESALVPLLSSQSTLPVVQATHGMHVQPNHIYV